jgi:phosphatidate cytidylyltransferase
MSIKRGREGSVGLESRSVFSSKLAQRVFLSAGFIPLVILVVRVKFGGALPFFAFTLALSVLCARELYGLFNTIFSLRSERWWVFCLPGSALIILFYLNSFFMLSYLGILYIMGYTIVIAAGCCFFCCYRGGFLRSFRVALLGYVYTGLLPLSMLWIRTSYGPLYVYFLFLLGWANDAGAYFVGTRFGRTRGIVRFSPSKSVEGYVAAFCVTVAAGVAFELVLKERFIPGVWAAVSLGFIIAICAPAGDIVESMMKRKAGVKDSSGFLPGFGGVLDIFDSILFASPVYSLVLFILQKFYRLTG